MRSPKLPVRGVHIHVCSVRLAAFVLVLGFVFLTHPATATQPGSRLQVIRVEASADPLAAQAPEKMNREELIDRVHELQAKVRGGGGGRGGGNGSSASSFVCQENSSSKCDDGLCSQEEGGPSSCTGGWCICLPGNCAVDGLCTRDPAGVHSCPMNTRTVCPSEGCGALMLQLGPTLCNNGYCHCKAGFCFSHKSQRCLLKGTLGDEYEFEEEEPKDNQEQFVPAPEKVESKAENRDVGSILGPGVLLVNLLILGCFAYWGHRNIIEGRPPYGIKLIQGEAAGDRVKNLKKLAAPESPEVVFYVEEAGLEELNGRYVLALDQRSGKPWWIKKALEGEVQYELWLDEDEWALGFMPSGDSDPAAKKSVIYVGPDDDDDGLPPEEPPEGMWGLGAKGESPPAPVLRRAEELVDEADKVTVEPGPTPEVLRVVSPNFNCEGEYVLMPDKLAQELPVWCRTSSATEDKDFIFKAPSGRWMVGDADEEMLEFAVDTGNLMSTDRSLGRWPHEMPQSSWQRYADEGGWMPDEKVEITLQSEPLKPPP